MYTLRCVSLAFFSMFFGTLFIESRNLTQANLFYRVFFLWWVSNSAPMLGVLAVAAQWIDSQTLRRELQDGIYHPISYVIAKTTIELPMMFVLGACNLVPAYVIGDWPWVSFPPMLLIWAVTLWAFEGVAQICSLEKMAVVGIVNFFQAWFMGMLFNGYMVPRNDIIWPFQVFSWIFPLYWTVEASTYALMIETQHYAGTRPCPDIEFSRNSSLAIMAGVTTPAQCLETPQAAQMRMAMGQRTFYCPFVAAQSCWGSVGADILISLESAYDCFSAANYISRNCFIIAAFGIACKICFSVRLTLLCGGKTPNPVRSNTAVSA